MAHSIHDSSGVALDDTNVIRSLTCCQRSPEVGEGLNIEAIKRNLVVRVENCISFCCALQQKCRFESLPIN